MRTLSAFLAENVRKQEGVKYIVSNRFVGEDGKAIPWEIGCITSEEDDRLRKDATKTVPVPGKRGQYAKETDYNEYMAALAVRCTLFPNLNDSELQNSYVALGATQLLKTMLTPGEYQRYLMKVQEVNGFDESIADLEEEAKN